MTLLLLLGALSIALVAGQLASLQHAALMEVYNATGCNATACPRFASSALCSGTVLTCVGTNVVLLNLFDLDLTGTISSSIGLLTALTRLLLSRNKLTGTISASIFQLTALTALHLNGNKLIGTIPSGIGLLKALTVLHLNDNELTGTIPPAVGVLTQLQQLYLTRNRLTGEIPNVGQLTKLEQLFLNENQLTGTIPSTLGQLKAMTTLYLYSNNLTGTIPLILGQMAVLRALVVSSNRLTGAIPSELGGLKNLTYLSLGNNDLAGTVPSTLGELTKLTVLYLFVNTQLTGAIPSSLARLTNLIELDLSNTQLNGTIPFASAPVNSTCAFFSTFLDCTSKPKSSCSCSARLLGDDCENRLKISDGSTMVSTLGATTCRGCGSCAIKNDVWREWTASCTGSATISACGFAPTDTMLGIYRGACPSVSTPTASGSDECNDFGSCGGSGQEEAALAVVSGESIIIRLGSASGAQLNGTLSISCSEMTLPPATATATAAAATTASANTTAASPANVSISATAPASTPSSGADIALIAGVVGGIAALLLVIGVVAAVVWRRRRSTAAPNGAALAPATPSSQYAAFRPGEAPQYDRLTPQEAAAMHYEATDAEFKP